MSDNLLQITTLRQLLEFDVARFIVIERQLGSSISHWIDMAGADKFKQVLYKYRDFINEHIRKMEDFFENKEFTGPAVSNRMMEVILGEAEQKWACCADQAIKDACLLASIQTINHCKISAYGTAAAFATSVGLENIAAEFRLAEVNEKQIDDRLSQLAIFEINARAKAPILEA